MPASFRRPTLANNCYHCVISKNLMLMKRHSVPSIAVAVRSQSFYHLAENICTEACRGVVRYCPEDVRCVSYIQSTDSAIVPRSIWFANTRWLLVMLVVITICHGKYMML